MTIFGLELFSGAKGADRSTSIVIAATDHSDERRWNHVKRLWELPRRPTLTRTSVGRWVAPYRNASDHKWQTPHIIFVLRIHLSVLCLLPKHRLSAWPSFFNQFERIAGPRTDAARTASRRIDMARS